MIKYIPVHQAKCDNCGQEILQTCITQTQFLIFIRSLQWTVGNTVLCPLCQTINKKKKIIPPQYEQLQLNFDEVKEIINEN